MGSGKKVSRCSCPPASWSSGWSDAGPPGWLFSSEEYEPAGPPLTLCRPFGSSGQSCSSIRPHGDHPQVTRDDHAAERRHDARGQSLISQIPAHRAGRSGTTGAKPDHRATTERETDGKDRPEPAHVARRGHAVAGPHRRPVSSTRLGDNLWLTIYDDLTKSDQAPLFEDLEVWFATLAGQGRRLADRLRLYDILLWCRVMGEEAEAARLGRDVLAD